MFNPEKAQTSTRLIQTKIILTGLLLGIVFILLSVHLANQYFKKIEEQRLTHLKQMVQIGINSIEPILTRYRSEEIGKDETLEKVIDRVRSMTYRDHAGRNYIFMGAYNGIMLVQSSDTKNEMTNQWDLKDESGLYIIRGLVETVRENADGGYFTYHYRTMDSSIPEEKISYVIGIPELDCFLGTGKYMGDIRKFQHDYLFRVIGLNVAILVLLVLLIIFSLREIQTKNRILHNEIELRSQTEKELIKHRNKLKELLEKQTKKIRANEVKYHKLYENANDAIFIMKETLFIDCNQKTLEIFGCKNSQIINRTPMDFSPDLQPDGRTSQEKAMEKIKLALENKPQFFEWRHCRYDGNTFEAEISLNRIDIGDETILQAIVRDVTDRKQLILELQEALENIKTLKGLLPICASCKKIRDDKGYWNQIEKFIQTHSDAVFSHGICPECEERLYGDQNWYKNRIK